MEELREKSTTEHPEVQSVSRETVNKTLKEERITENNFTKYEKARLIADRAQLIAEVA